MAVVAGMTQLVQPGSTDYASASPPIAPDVPVTPMHRGLGLASNSPSIVSDPTDARFVVLANRLDAPDFGCALQISGDRGKRWRSVQAIAELPSGADKCYGPQVAFDRQGKLYYLFVGLAEPGNEPMGVFLTTSLDRGRSFSAPRRILGPLNFAVRMAMDPTIGEEGRLHLAWLHATSDPPLGGFGSPPNPIFAAYSDDGGQTFSKPVQVSDPDRERVVAPALALGPDNTVYVGYYDLEDDARDYQGLEGPTWGGTWSLVAAKSSDGGRRFGRGSVIDDSVVPFDRVMLIFTMSPPALVAAPEGSLCAAWTDARYGDADALMRCSTNGGGTWGKDRRLNDDPTGNGALQYLPHLSVAPDGRLDAVFYDRRGDSENVRNDVYYTLSTDGGKTLVPNIRLTDQPSDSRIGQQYINASARGQVEFGLGLALLSERRAALAAWTDTRNSLPFSTGQDIFATRIIFRRPEAGYWGERAGVGMIALGVLAITTAVVRVVRGRRRREAAREAS